MDLVQVSNGFGQVLPHKVFALDDAGLPSANLISIQNHEDLLANVRSDNVIQPVASFPIEAILPNGEAGNHFFMAEFTEDLLVDSVLSSSPGLVPSNSFTGTIVVQSVDPQSGTTTTVPGRAFINGYTYGTTPTGSPAVLPLERWVDDAGNAIALGVNSDQFPGLGFPGTEQPFAGQNALISPRTVVFIPDADGMLATHETFPAGIMIHMRIETGVQNTEGRNIARTALASTMAGPDMRTPEIRVSLPPTSVPDIVPGAGDMDVDPMTSIVVIFNEPVQPWSLGDLPINVTPTLSSSISIKFGPPTARVDVPFSVLPVSVFDFSRYELTPAYNFPGEGPVDLQCGVFNRIDVTVNPNLFVDLAGNVNALSASTFFTTGEGPGLVNAPIAPDTIYVARGGANPGISVIDLNGFGQSTGNPTYDPSFNVFQPGWSNFPNNPNVKLQGSVIRPALSVGSCTVNGGSSGVFSLTRDSSLNDLLIRTPVVLNPGDMMLGHSLDQAFNNGPVPFGCQANGGNLCATTGQKLIQVMQGGPNTLIPTYPPPLINNQTLASHTGGENSISFAPHPNPPPLLFPPLCISPFIGGQEPTSIFTVLPLPPAAPPNGLGLRNLLVSGDPLGDPLNGEPPGGLLSPEQNAWMHGPHAPQPVPGACLNYMIRQQIGQFMYVIDRARKELVVFNSNNMLVIDRIQLPDPTDLAMSPNLDYIAISNQSVDLVSFVDTNPTSSTFHQIIQTTVVGRAPRGIVWDPGNEDILVCNELDSTVSIMSAFSLTTRKLLTSQLNRPFDLAITQRQSNFGFLRNVYFAYIMNRTGRLAMFESGPNSVNGWGFDDIIGSASMTFLNPKKIQPDNINVNSGVWVVHEGPFDPLTGSEGGVGIPAVSNLKIESGFTGAIPLSIGSLLIPQFRDLSLAITVSLGGDVISGVPVDIAFDNMRNFGALANHQSLFSAGVPLPNNGKSLVRTVNGLVQNSNEPQFMFVAVPSPSFGSEGLVDVIDIGGGYTITDTNGFLPGTQSISCSNASGMMDYFRQ
ncbi:MAG: DNA-binding beta-propeller fold protein YncE [Planctomycetota bacterium]|jgi:DNA-binding beta-propeller fold protein YncE